MGQLKKILREQILAEMTYERTSSTGRWMPVWRSSWENSR